MTTTITEMLINRDAAMAEAVRRWTDGNNSGDGYEPGSWLEEATLILRARTNTEVDVYRLPDGREVAVADVNGPWAVDMED